MGSTPSYRQMVRNYEAGRRHPDEGVYLDWMDAMFRGFGDALFALARRIPHPLAARH